MEKEDRSVSWLLEVYGVLTYKCRQQELQRPQVNTAAIMLVNSIPELCGYKVEEGKSGLDHGLWRENVPKMLFETLISIKSQLYSVCVFEYI